MKPSAIVTGGASGIGLATAEWLLNEGWPVAVVDLDIDALARAEDVLESEQALFLALDITDEYAVAEVFDQVVDALGPVGGLVNSAGIVYHSPAIDTDIASLRKVLDVNLVGSFVASRAAVERMAETLSIVNIAAVSGLRANHGGFADGASRAGVKLMTEVMAIELAHREIRVNCVAPGTVGSPLSVRHSGEAWRGLLQQVPQRRFGEPDEVAAAISFLLSPEAGYITGQTIAVDGGFMAAGTVNAD